MKLGRKERCVTLPLVSQGLCLIFLLYLPPSLQVRIHRAPRKDKKCKVSMDLSVNGPGSRCSGCS